jgi:hypothetical protein
MHSANIANYKAKAKRRKHELAVSKKRGDEYRAADKKAKTTSTTANTRTMTGAANTTTTRAAEPSLQKVPPPQMS